MKNKITFWDRLFGRVSYIEYSNEIYEQNGKLFKAVDKIAKERDNLKKSIIQAAKNISKERRSWEKKEEEYKQLLIMKDLEIDTLKSRLNTKNIKEG